MDMLIAAIVLFLIGGIFGLVNLIAILQDKPTMPLTVLMHGIFVFIPLLMVITYAATGHGSTLFYVSLGFFIAAALGGFTLLAYDLQKKPIPKAIAIVHPMIAVTGLILLIIFVVEMFS
jgi:hypothetical protein